MLPPLPLVDAEPEPETEPESSIPPHIRRLIKGKQPQRHASSGSGFIDMTSHLYSPRLPPTDSDTDESSFWSTADTSMSSNTSALLSDTSMSVRMDVVRFDWPSSPKSGPAHPQPSDKTQKIHRAKSAPNMSPDRFIPRHSVQDDALLHRSTISTPRSVRLARHLGFVIGDGQPYVSSEGKFEERLRRARRQSNATSAEDETTPTEESVSFIRRAMAGAMVEREQSSAQSSTRIGSHSTRSLSPTLLRGRPSDHTGPNTPAAFSRDASPNPFHSTIHETSLASRPTLHHSISETSLNATTSRLSLDTENSYRVSSPEASFRSSTPASSGHFPEPSLRQLPHERALLLRAASTLITPSPHIPSDIAGIGASGAAMSWGMGVSITSMRGRTLTGIAAPSPSSRFHMQRAPVHVYDAPDILEDYYAAPFAWNYATSEQSFTQRASKNKQSTTDPGSGPDSTSDSTRDDHLPGGVLACALGMSVFFSRVSGSKLLQIEQLCSLEEGRGLQSTVEWGRPNGGCENSLAVGQTDGGLEIWDVPTRRMVNRLRAPTLLHLPDASFTPSQVFALSWNRNLLAAGLEGCGLLWDTRAPGGEKAAFRLSAHGKNKVCGMKWREDGEMLATGGDDRMVCVWDVRMPKKPVLSSGNGDGKFTSRRPMWKKKIHGAAVKALAWCPWAPNILASGGGKSDGTVCFWDAQTGTLKDTLQLGSQITSIYFSPVCREFVTTHGLRTSTARPTQPTEFQTFDPHADQTGPLPDTANSIVTHAYPSLARVAHVPNLHGMRISHASLSPDGSRLMTGGTFEALVMWSLWGAVAKQEEQGIGSFVDFATYSRHILAALNSYTPSLSSLYLYIVTAMVANNQATFLTCRFHTAGINMMCIDCLVISGFALPTPPPYANPYAPFVSWTQPQTGPKPLGALNANNMFSSDEETYMHKMRFALQEMDSQFEFVPDGNFLDLGCCPGGFSTYVLSKWPNARGFGVSLPVEFGGHSLAVPMELRDRLEVHWADVTMFDLAPSLIHGFWDTTIFTPCPIPPRAFDFVMVDGHQPPCLSKDDPRAPWSRDRLLLSQLLAALRAINPWGTLLAKLSLQVSVPLMERIVLALSRLTPLPIRAIKPTSIYATAATFYILIQSPIPSLCDRLVRILEGLWYFMTFGGPNGFGRGLSESDMDLIATYPEILVAKQQLKFLFAPIEEVRRAAKFKVAPVVSA